MKEEIFRCLGIIKNNSKSFMLLSNAKTFKYILEISDKNELQYPQFEDYIHFNNLFNTTIEISSIFSKSNAEKIDVGKKITIIPKVIYKGALISISSALLLSGCGLPNNSNNESVITEEVTTEYEETWEEKNKDTIEYLSTCTDEEFIKFLNWEIERINENLVIVRHSGEKRDFSESMIVNREVDYYYSNSDTTKNYFEDQINIDTLCETINQNDSINETYKRYLIEGLNNISNNIMFSDGIDFNVLNYNLKRMKIIEVSKNEIKEKAGASTYAYFEHSTGYVYIPDTMDNDDFDWQKHVIRHEILGHASSNAEINDGDKNIKISQAIEVLEIQGEGSKRQIRTKSIGNFYNEALADLIAVYGSEDMNTKNCAYKQELVELKFLINLENISMYTVLDDGLIGIINSYDSSLTNDLIEFIDNADATTTSEIIGKDYSGITAKDNIKNFSIVYGKSLKGKEDDTEIINKINKASMGIFEETELNEIMNEINKDTLIENDNSKDNLEKEDERE